MGYDPDDYLLLSGIQHFSFCRRQWALIHIEQVWHENGLTAEGRIIHERVHDAHITDIRNGVLTVRNLPVRSENLGITGCCDAVEFIPDEQGIVLHDRAGRWAVCPVEYKHGTSKLNDCDRLQVTAQAMCLEEMFCCHIPEGYVFYHENRRREKVLISDELRGKVKSMFEEMHNLFSKGHTPRVKAGKACGNCSLSEYCLPVLMKNRALQSVTAYINEEIEGDPL